MVPLERAGARGIAVAIEISGVHGRVAQARCFAMKWPVFIERKVPDVREVSSEMLRRFPQQVWKLTQIGCALLCLSGLHF